MHELLVKGCLLKLIWSDGAVEEVTIPTHLRKQIDEYLDEVEVTRNLNEFTYVKNN
jgi:hypothetical protein